MATTRFVIHWKSKVNGRVGQGSKVFTCEEAHQLVEELNREYPEIEHDMIPASSDEPEASNIVQLSREPAEQTAEGETPALEKRAEKPGVNPDLESNPGKIISRAE